MVNKIKEKKKSPKNKDNKDNKKPKNNSIDNKKNNNKPKSKSKKKIQNGGNIFRASINLVKECIGLGGQMFKTAGGIMRMPADLAVAAKPVDTSHPAQTEPSPPKEMPNNELQQASSIPVN